MLYRLIQPDSDRSYRIQTDHIALIENYPGDKGREVVIIKFSGGLKETFTLEQHVWEKFLEVMHGEADTRKVPKQKVAQNN
jgi:hypothetical protein